MKTRKIKSSSDIKLAGIDSTARFVDGTVRQVTLSDGSGGILILEAGQYGGIDVTVPAPPELVKKFELSGVAVGLPVKELFDSRREAQRRQDELLQLKNERCDSSLGIAEVEVPATEESSVEVEIPF